MYGDVNAETATGYDAQFAYTDYIKELEEKFNAITESFDIVAFAEYADSALESFGIDVSVAENG